MATDAELAGTLGITTAAFSRWRWLHGLPGGTPSPNYTLGKRAPIVTPEERRRYAAYADHPSWTDSQIAAYLGIERTTFRLFRLKHGLPPHRRRGERGCAPRLDQAEEARRIAEYRRHRGRSTDAKLAESLGLSKDTLARWRRKRGLDQTSRSASGATRVYGRFRDALEEECRRLEAYVAAKTTNEAARRVGLTNDAFARWLRKVGLPPRRMTPDAANARARMEQVTAQLRARRLQDAVDRLRHPNAQQSADDPVNS